MTKPRVLLTGPQWFGDLLASCERGLSELGVEVCVLATNITRRLQRADRLRQQLARVPVAGGALGWQMQQWQRRQLAGDLHNELTRKAAEFQPDLLLAILCWGETLSGNSLDGLHGIEKIGWVMDDPFQRDVGVATILGCFDHLFVVDESWVIPIRLLTGRNVDVMVCGADLRSYRLLPALEIPEDRRCAIVFVGTSYHGQAAGLVRRSLLTSVADLSLHIYGDRGWTIASETGRGLSQCYRGGELTSEQTNVVYNGSDIVLNIHHPQFREGTSLRTFAICASRAFQLTDWRNGLDRYFVPEVEVVTYRSSDELREKAQYYRDRKADRLRIAQAGYERVRREHTYRHRLAQMLVQAGILTGVEASYSLAPSVS